MKMPGYPARVEQIKYSCYYGHIRDSVLIASGEEETDLTVNLILKSFAF